MPANCIYLTKADEAYRIDALTGRETPTVVHICEWPEQRPDRLVDAPRWLLKLAGGGLAIDPERDCPNCPARQIRRPAEIAGGRDG